uniref:EGF-like domain-containing protein n=1 Tax=Magallana gigas TaxID=29159 RepID=A0A8W8MM41_MAGGI
MEKLLCLMTVALIIANGGTFTNNDGCFTCTCADGWAGALCNEAVSELASGKPVKQSTTYYSSSANFAVDGNKEERTVRELMWQPGCVMLPSL